MKRILLCFLAVALGFTVDAQTSFAPLGATWQFNVSSHYYYHARSVATTSIQGKTCSIVNYYWHRKDYPAALYDTRVFCTSGDTVFFNSDNSQLQPLYIFNVPAGDTIPFYNGLAYNSDSFFHVRIDSTKLQLWGATLLRTVWGKTVAPALGDPDWRGYRLWDTTSQILYVERLGAIGGNGLMPWHPVIYGEEQGGVGCYYDGTLDVRLNGSDSCNGIPEGVEPLTTTGFTMYPNPATSFCNIRFAQPIPATAQLAVYDIVGKSACFAVLPGGITTWELDTRKWSPGVYLLEISSASNKLHQRLLKE